VVAIGVLDRRRIVERRIVELGRVPRWTCHEGSLFRLQPSLRRVLRPARRLGAGLHCGP
jgi:hypothetical protein